MRIPMTKDEQIAKLESDLIKARIEIADLRGRMNALEHIVGQYNGGMYIAKKIGEYSDA